MTGEKGKSIIFLGSRDQRCFLPARRTSQRRMENEALSVVLWTQRKLGTEFLVLLFVIFSLSPLVLTWWNGSSGVSLGASWKILCLPWNTLHFWSRLWWCNLPPPFVCCSFCVSLPCPALHVCSALPAWVFCFPSVAQKIVSTKKKQQLSIGPCKSLPNSPSHSSVCSAQVSAVHISQVQTKQMLERGTHKLLFISSLMYFMPFQVLSLLLQR